MARNTKQYATDKELDQYINGTSINYIDETKKKMMSTSTNGIECLPYQFMESVDRRVINTDGIGRKYADKIYHFIAPKITGDNESKSCFDFRKIKNIDKCINFKIKHIEKYGEDILLTYYPEK